MVSVSAYAPATSIFAPEYAGALTRMNDPGGPDAAAGTRRPSVADAVPAIGQPEPPGAPSCAAVHDVSAVPVPDAMLTATV